MRRFRHPGGRLPRVTHIEKETGMRRIKLLSARVAGCVLTPFVLTPIAATLLLAGGCAMPTAPDRAERMTRGYVYYLDGASGGSLLRNWAGGVQQGLLDAGYDGAGEMYTWQTGLGLVEGYRSDHPDPPITIIGLSAGTAIAAFTLEQMPAKLMVENVIMLSGSLSATYDLTAALRHVNGKMYVFTSHRDSVLTMLLPVGGTADRASGTTETIGVEGPRLPEDASAETRSLYAEKIVLIAWNEEFKKYGHQGGHTDSVKAPFVREFVAPLVPTMAGAARVTTPVSAEGKVENPDYARWARFAPGSWIEYAGYQVVNGVREPVHMRVTLVDEDANGLFLQRKYLPTEGGQPTPILPQGVFVDRLIEPEAHPMTHPDRREERRGTESVTIGTREVECEVVSLSATGNFPVWGTSVSGVIYSSKEVPGGMVRLEARTQMERGPVEFSAEVVDFHAVE
jgi:pimeloyl-ACP methyl ester carboxylesterase